MEEAPETKSKPFEGEKQSEIVLCPMCGNEMTFLQACHLRCNFCGAELSCEDKGWFWG